MKFCIFGIHKPIKTNPEKGIASKVVCENCGNVLQEEIVWPEPGDVFRPQEDFHKNFDYE